jgi:hypothetical protein
VKGLANRLAAVILLGFFFVLSPWAGLHSQDQSGAAGETAQTAGLLQEGEEIQEDVIHPGPQNIQERLSIAVFLAWMWFSIAVLLYFIRLLVREVDRVHKLDLYGLRESRKSGPPSDG